MNELEQCIKIKNIIENNPKTKNTKNIYTHVCSVLFEECNHHLVYDNIDIDIDKSMDICYCSKCFLTFHSEFIYSYLHFKLNPLKKDKWQIHHYNTVYNMNDFFIKNTKITISVFTHKDNTSLFLHFDPCDFLNAYVSDTSIVI